MPLRCCGNRSTNTVAKSKWLCVRNICVAQKFIAPAMDHQSHYDYMLNEQETVAKSAHMHISPSDNLLHSTGGGGMIVIIDCVEMHRFVNGHYLPVKSLCDIILN